MLEGDPQLRSPEGTRYKAFPHTRPAALGKIETATSMSAPGRSATPDHGQSTPRSLPDPKQSVETTRERRSTGCERTFDVRQPRRVRSEPSPAALRH